MVDVRFFVFHYIDDIFSFILTKYNVVE